MTEISIADTFKALGDENRARIIKLLVCCDMCVCDIMDNMDLSQPAVSHHLKILNNAGLVTARREGKWVYYCLSSEKHHRLIEELEELYKKPEHCPYRTHVCDEMEREGMGNT